nr:hypothetical protein [Tanacetum cinerariifolium]
MDAKLAWLLKKYYCRSQTHIGDVYLTAEELHQLYLDEEALRETLKEQLMDEKAREEKIIQKQADDDEFFLKFGKNHACNKTRSKRRHDSKIHSGYDRSDNPKKLYPYPGRCKPKFRGLKALSAHLNGLKRWNQFSILVVVLLRT